jgi:aryl-alcohol dehydrogenase-like predicted oxidoreductase
MDERELGAGGPMLSVVGLGCNNFGQRIDAAASAAVVQAALDAGITHFDTAEMYGDGLSEEFLGAALGSRRDEIVIATKYSPRPAGEPFTPGLIAARIREAAEASLRRLGTDHIDVYYQHRPDPDAPIDEILETLAELVRSGKVLHIASSDITAEQIVDAESTSAAKGLPRFTATQIEWSLMKRAVEESIVPAAAAAQQGVVPYFPLASGLLTGKYRRGEPFPEGTRLANAKHYQRLATDEAFDQIEAFERFAVDRGHSLTELAIAWLLAQPTVTSVIAGATKPEQITANVAAAGWALSAADAALAVAGS